MQLTASISLTNLCWLALLPILSAVEISAIPAPCSPPVSGSPLAREHPGNGEATDHRALSYLNGIPVDGADLVVHFLEQFDTSLLDLLDASDSATVALLFRDSRVLRALADLRDDTFIEIVLAWVSRTNVISLDEIFREAVSRENTTLLKILQTNHNVLGNLSDLQRDAALSRAAQNGDLATMSLLLKDAARPSEGVLLSIAIALKTNSILTTGYEKMLCSFFQMYSAVAVDELVPLSLGVATHNEKVVRCLLEHGEDPFHLEDDTLSLDIALSLGDEDIAWLLLTEMFNRDGWLKPEGDEGHRAELFRQILHTKNGEDLAKYALEVGEQGLPRFLQDKHRILALTILSGVSLLLENYLAHIDDEDFSAPMSLLESTILHFAVRSGSLDFVAFLLAREADPFYVDEQGDTPITVAVVANDEGMLNLLLSGKKRPTQCPNCFWKELRLCAMRGNVGLLTLFHDRGVNLGQSYFDETLLNIAVKHNQPDTVRLLLRIGHSFNLLSALQQSMTVSVEILSILLEHGAADQLLDTGGYVSYLLGQVRCHSSLHGACASTKMFHILLDHAPQLMQTDESGRSLLITAIAERRPDIVEILLIKGADPNFTDASGESALHRAAALGCTNSVNLLIHHGADTQAQDKQGDTPLMTALFARQFGSALKMLVHHKVEPCAASLRYLEKNGMLEFVRRSVARVNRKSAQK